MPAKKQTRLVTGKLVLKLMQQYSISVFNSKHYGSIATDIIIALGASVSVMEGRPLTAAKLSEYVCVPRATVVRRVAIMARQGILRTNDKKQIFLTVEAGQRAAHSIPDLNKATIVRTAGFLSKMDSESVAITTNQK